MLTLSIFLRYIGRILINVFMIEMVVAAFFVDRWPFDHFSQEQPFFRCSHFVGALASRENYEGEGKRRHEKEQIQGFIHCIKQHNKSSFCD